jgi:GH43 family beta-xylosidase
LELTLSEFSPLIQPLIEQRADPFIYKHHDGYYYFIASVPEYDRLELRRAQTLAGLADAPKVAVWHKPDSGPYSDLIWAPEIHWFDDIWCIYFAAAPSREIVDGLFQHRMYALTTNADNPMEGEWQLEQVDSGIDSFCLGTKRARHTR